jgi:hypothetical protein
MMSFLSLSRMLGGNLESKEAEKLLNSDGDLSSIQQLLVSRD